MKLRFDSDRRGGLALSVALISLFVLACQQGPPVDTNPLDLDLDAMTKLPSGLLLLDLEVG